MFLCFRPNVNATGVVCDSIMPQIFNFSDEAVCLNNATDIFNGQFSKTIMIKAPKGQRWQIYEAHQFYKASSLNPPLIPIPVLPKEVLTESSLSSIESFYAITGKIISGSRYKVVLKNNLDQYFTIDERSENYNIQNISGPISVCTDEVSTYWVAYNNSGYSLKVQNGMIVSSNADSSQIRVQWRGTSGVGKIKFTPKGTAHCAAPSTIEVAIGRANASLVCRSEVSVSLNSLCSTEILPSIITTNELLPNSPYILTLIDNNGHVLPSNFINENMVGKTFTAKLFSGCGGNSCWGTLKIEDKVPPTIKCGDTLKIACTDIGHQEVVLPTAYDNCTLMDNVTLVSESTENLLCDPQYLSIIKREYKAKDKSNNVSPSCTQIIAVKKIIIANIDLPLNRTGDNPLTCGSIPIDKNGYPDPKYTGAPCYRGVNLFEQKNLMCNVVANYSDQDYNYIGCMRKLLRTWTIMEWWCGKGNLYTFTQELAITDNEVPQITCPKNLTISTNIGECEAKITLPNIPQIKDNCVNNFTTSISYPGGIIQNETENKEVVLASGHNKVEYTVYDECGNNSKCNIDIYIHDKTAPLAICRNNLTVALTEKGNTLLYKESIDKGSYDLCGFDSIKIKRIDQDSTCMKKSRFADAVEFCCLDVEKDIMVEMRVWDKAGNENACMATIRIQDKILPSISCPQNDTIKCIDTYDLKNLKTFGEAIANDACGVIITEEVVENINQCREGELLRIFTASTKGSMAQCTSKIVIKNVHENAKVMWPKDFEVENVCSMLTLHPDSLSYPYNRPVLINGSCDLISATYEDERFVFEPGLGSCFKILRKWTVIEHCKSTSKDYTPLVYDQVIKVFSTVAPTIEVVGETEICNTEGDCNQVLVNIVANGQDDCTLSNDLRFTYAIDTSSSDVFIADTVIEGSGSVINISKFFPYGKHQILFTFYDQCGNQTSKHHEFNIKNCKAPTAVCLQEVSLTLNEMSIGGEAVTLMACVKASSLNQSSYSQCGSPLKYSFSEDTKDLEKCFNCDDIGKNELKLYVTDQFGNQSICKSSIIINNINGMSLFIDGSSEICEGESVNLTAVTNSTQPVTWSTGETTKSIRVTPLKSTVYTVNGVSTEGCKMEVRKEIKVFPKVVEILSDGRSVCDGKALTLSVNEVGKYKWSQGGDKNNITVLPSVATVYSVTIVNESNCVGKGTASIKVGNNPTFSITNPSNVCPGTNTTIAVTAFPNNSTFRWSSGATQSQTTVRPDVQSSSYTVTVTNAEGCSALGVASVPLHPKPKGVITGDSLICEGERTILTASGGGTYIWNFDNLSTTSINVGPTRNFFYSITVTNSFGCRDIANLEVKVKPKPSVSVDGNFNICLGDSTTLSVNGVDAATSSYMWSQGSKSQSIIAKPIATTNYTVTVTAPSGCFLSLTKTVNVGNCLNNQVIIDGTVTTVDNVPIKDFTVILSYDDVDTSLTDDKGKFEFNNLSKNTTYQLSLFKNDDWTNGVSTIDLIKIQRHILGIEKFDEPYKYLAADINHDGKINATDLLELRKFLLGINKSFKNNHSWMAVPKDYIFSDLINPLVGMPASFIAMESLTSRASNDFTAVKIGDVDNFSGRLSANRSNLISPLYYQDKEIVAHEMWQTEFKSKDKNVMSGAYIEMDLAFADDIEVSSSFLSPQEFDYHHANGKLRIILNPNQSVDLSNKVLFVIKGRATRNTFISKILSYDNFQNLSEVYLGDDAYKIVLNPEVTVDKYIDILVYPNPAASEIHISIPYNAQCTIFGENGTSYGSSTLKESELNTISIDNLANGIYFLHIKENGVTKIKKVRVVK
jgi:hypothetical protein